MECGGLVYPEPQRAAALRASASGARRPSNSICFFFAHVLLSSSRFQQVLRVTPCPQTETCHPEDFRLVPKVVRGMRMSGGSQPEVLRIAPATSTSGTCFSLCRPPDLGTTRPAVPRWRGHFWLCGLDPGGKQNAGGSINQMVSSPFRYVPRRGYVSFPAQSPSGRSCSMNSLLFSTEV